MILQVKFLFYHFFYLFLQEDVSPSTFVCILLLFPYRAKYVKHKVRKNHGQKPLNDAASPPESLDVGAEFPEGGLADLS
ncbi:MAG: hypothetical protein R2941_09090 [Desulfobacterales bacterium]